MKLKILIVSEYFPPKGKGGGEISAEAIANNLAKNKEFEVHVLTSYFPGLKKKEKHDNLRIHRTLKTGDSPSTFLGNIKRASIFKKSLLKELKKLNKKHTFHIIHCFNSTSIYAVKLKKRIRARFILQLHGPVLFCPKATLMYKDKYSCNVRCNLLNYTRCYFCSNAIGKMNFSPLLKYNPAFYFALRARFSKYRKLIKKFDSYIAISDYMKKRAMLMGVKKEMISVIPHPIAVDDYLKLKSSQNKIPRILYLGEYSRNKGPNILLKALKKLKVKYKASFYGEGVLKDEFVQDVKKNKLPITINNKVSNKEIPEILQKHDIVVVPSFVGEALGKAAIESRAAGKIVVASDVGGLPEVIDKDKGFLFEPGNSDKLAQLLEDIINKKIKIDQEKIRENISKYSLKQIMPKIKKIYFSLK